MSVQYKTCGGRPGSLGYEDIDATTYASWGVHYLKYDNCNTDNTKPEVHYPVMRNALNKTGRHTFYPYVSGVNYVGTKGQHSWHISYRR